MAKFNDAFTGTNGDKLNVRSGWTKFGSGFNDTLEINANALRTSNEDSPVIGQDKGGANHYIKCTLLFNMSGTTNSERWRVWLRVIDRNDGLYIFCDAGVWGIYKTVAGRLYASAGGQPADSGTLVFAKVDGNICTLNIDGTNILSGDVSDGTVGGTALNAVTKCGVSGNWNGSAAHALMDDYESGLISDLVSSEPKNVSDSGNVVATDELMQINTGGGVASGLLGGEDMIQYRWLAGSTSRSVLLKIADATTGAAKTDVVFNSGGLDLKYRREGAAAVDITEVTQTVNGAYSSGGFIHVGGGYYRVDLPDAAIAAGVTGVLTFGSVTGGVISGAYVHLAAVNDQDGVRMGLTALPNAAAGANAGLPLVGSQIPNATAGDAGGLHSEIVARFDTNLQSQAGLATNEFKGSTSDEATDNNKRPGMILWIYAGTGLGQLRSVKSYTASTRVYVVDRAWGVVLDNTSAYRLLSGSMLAALTDAEVYTAVMAQVMTEAVSADNAVPTLQQAMIEILAKLGEFSITGTTITYKKRDGATTLLTATIDSAAAPTSITRAT